MHSIGLQYGPGYRVLARAWIDGDDATALVYRRWRMQGTDIHPADLDGALQLSKVVSQDSEDVLPLPFSITAASIQHASRPWQSVSAICKSNLTHLAWPLG